jgi:hypothetical protein
MNGKWHVHFGDGEKPSRSSDFDTREQALAEARALKYNVNGPRFRFISRPDSAIMPDAEVALGFAKNPAQPGARKRKPPQPG